MPDHLTIAVTGVSGFIAQHILIRLLSTGHIVHGTVRSLDREAKIHSALIASGLQQETVKSNLHLFPAELLNDSGWQEAFAGCTQLLHLASPYPLEMPKDENELIIPAVEGTKRVLRFAKASGTIKRVVVTSSESAVHFGLPHQAKPFDESHWTDVTQKSVSAYQKSKTLAERAAWEFMENEGEAAGMVLATVNPSTTLGPASTKDIGASLMFIRNAVNNKYAQVPKISVNFVDVRDVADLHVLALMAEEEEKVRGQRFICDAGEPVSMKEVVMAVKKCLEEKGEVEKAKKIKEPTELSDRVLKLAAWVNEEARLVTGMLGKTPVVSSDNAISRLGWKRRGWREALEASVTSLISVGAI